MDRLWQTLWIASTLCACWWTMLVVHELGHMLAAWLTGGRVAGWELKPWSISRTDVDPNPQPLAVAWGGAGFGVFAPIAVAPLGRRSPRARSLLWFFAGFCLIANGAYLAFGSIDRVGDAGELLRHGASAWQLWLFGIVAALAGLWIWHHLVRLNNWHAALSCISRRSAALMLALAIALFGSMSAWGQPPAATPQRVMIGYYASFGDLEIEQIPWHRLTHLCHAFMRTDGNGKLLTDEKVPSKALTEAAHKNNVRVLLSLGGGRTTDGFEQVTADEKKLAGYVDEVVKLAVKNGYDGIDVDWEHPHSKETQAQFTRLIAAFRKNLDEAQLSQQRPEKYQLTAAISATKYFGRHIDVENVIDHFDWLHVMTYDFAGPWSKVAAHNAPLLASRDDPERAWRSVSTAMEYWHDERKVPKKKLVVGLPFYGRAFPATKRYEPLDPAKKNQHGTLTFRQTRGLIDNKWKADWDEDLQTPWLATPDGKALIVAYDDRNSIYKKTTWTRQQGYRGVFFWAIHQDRMPDGKHWLLEASYRAWPK
ncbi:MAG: glycosyl hydrolase family 18 protein [Aeoliella sp.]